MSGFEKQTYTQVPNSLFEVMGDMDECELKVVLYICRYTFGYHRDTVKISTRKMADAIGMNTASVAKGAEAAERRGLIERINDGQNTTEWRALVAESDSKSESPDPEVIQKVNHPVSDFESQVGLNKDKEKDSKETGAKPSRKKIELHGIEAAIAGNRPVELDDLPGPDPVEWVLVQLEKGLHRNIPRSGTWQDLGKWILRRDEPLAEWVKWYMSDPFNAKTAWRLTPDQIRAAWPQAFTAKKSESHHAPIITLRD